MKYRNLTVVVVVLSIVSSCRNDDNNSNSNSVEGQWKMVKTEVVYSKDGSVKAEAIFNGDCEGKSNITLTNGNTTTSWYGLQNGKCDVIDKSVGTYVKDGNKLITKIGDNIETHDILTLTKTDFVLQGDYGKDLDGDGKNELQRVTLKK